MRSPSFRVAIPTVVLLIGTACSPIPFRQTPEDQPLTRDVRAALAADTTANVMHVTATTYGGYAVLSGWADEAGADRARQIARGVPGVRDVVDQIVVPERMGD
jgi:osmotically-inducible protein OsmY